MIIKLDEASLAEATLDSPKLTCGHFDTTESMFCRSGYAEGREFLVRFHQARVARESENPNTWSDNQAFENHGDSLRSPVASDGNPAAIRLPDSHDLAIGPLEALPNIPESN